MTRLLLCTSIACLAASCAPPKAILVEEAPVVQPDTKKPANPRPERELLPVPQVAQRSGMRVRDPSKELPEGKDFAPTAPSVNNASAVIASPPDAKKPAPAAGNKPRE
jgi:hypothetical protein